MSKTALEEINPRIRIMLGEEVAFGPGKAELLGLVEETGSLNQAAKRMEMSYMKAWLLIQVVNRSFNEPLVKTERGGANGGGAELTKMGKLVLSLYREMHEASLRTIEPQWAQIRQLLKIEYP